MIFEGTFDKFPGLKICAAHGGGYLPYYAGRVDRNYHEKPYTRVHMTKLPSDYIKQNFYYDTSVYNPDLLEYLAQSFVEGGLSIKKLHRQILLSAVYQLSAADSAAPLPGRALRSDDGPRVTRQRRSAG